MITLGLVLLTVADAVLISAYYQRSYSIGLDLKTKAIRSLIRRSQSTYNPPCLGKLNNLLTKDVSSVKSFVPFLHMAWSCPLQIILCTWSIYKIFGLSSTLAGVITLGICTLIVPFATKRIIKLRKEYQFVNDKRIDLHSYWLNNYIEVKWGPHSSQIQSLIDTERNQEVSLLNQTNVMRIILRSVNNLSPLISFLVTMLWFTFISKENVSSSLIIKAIALFNLLRSPLQWIPSISTRLGEVASSLHRIEEALGCQCEEIDTDKSSAASRFS